MFSDALLLLFELADKEDERFQVAAARWHARFVLEANLPLRDAEGMMTLLCRLRGADRHVVRRRLLLSVELWDFDGTLAERPGMWGGCMLEVLDDHEPNHG